MGSEAIRHKDKPVSITREKLLSPMFQFSNFTSESVSEGHPDKIADQISDAILDAILQQDKQARVACESLVKTGAVIIAGEITTNAWIDLEPLVRKVVLDIGYNSSELGFDGATCSVINMIGKQSADIARGVNRKEPEKQGAGDQGIMFGYACEETSQYLPAPIFYANSLTKRQASVRKKALVNWLRPDAKSQVTCCYEAGKVTHIDNIVLSTQHDPHVKQQEIEEAIVELIIKPIIPAHLINKHTKFHINPTGRFITGGPVGDCGLTGRKIIVDTYGGMARHGGGAFSGKDPSKVDRSGAYVARYIAKNVVASGLARYCEIQLSYAIGISRPTSLAVNTFGTGRLPDEKLKTLISELFDITPYGIIASLGLLQPIYQKTASYGHFGRTPKEGKNATFFSWEKTDKKDILATY